VADLEAGGGGDPLIQPLSDADFVTLRLYNRRQDRAVSQVRPSQRQHQDKGRGRMGTT
jgi:hypothetical protein